MNTFLFATNGQLCYPPRDGNLINPETVDQKNSRNKWGRAMVIYYGVLSTGRLRLDLWYKEQNSPFLTTFSVFNNFSLFHLEIKKQLLLKRLLKQISSLAI